MLGASMLAQTYLGGAPLVAAAASASKGYAKATDAATNGAKASNS
jgi:hypothetical protein